MSPPLSDRREAPGHGVVVQLAELIALQPLAGRPGALTKSCSGAQGCKPQALGINSQGMAFAGSRPHQNGDDRRAIDWRQSARRGRLYTKQFAEEHERPVQFLVDMGMNMRFGTRGAFKSVVAARIAGHLAWRFFASGERVGGLAWTGRPRPILDARHKIHGLMPLLKQLADASAETPAEVTGIDWPMSRLAKQPGRAATIVISDFADLSAEAERSLWACARRHHLVLIQVHDPFECDPPPGIYRLDNGQDTQTLDLHPGRVRQEFIDHFVHRRERLVQLARSAGAGYLPVATNADLRAVLSGAGRHFSPERHASTRA